MLFSGDIYDLEDRSIKAQIVFKEEMQRLNDQGIPVCLIHGNHDFLGNDPSCHSALAFYGHDN
ncbi:MAG: hypothetical protein LRY37_02060 [Alkalibacterium thalassium]|nr:hypothetical protein [Alkalibacterium thalassium]